MKTKPELDNMIVRSKIDNNEQLLNDEIINLVSFINDSTVLEIDGGLGLIAEHLSATNSVRLCEDGRLYFSYRRKLFPQSKVIEMNISPSAINENYRIVDYVIIHSEEFLEKAKKLAKKSVILTHNLSIISTEEKVTSNDKENWINSAVSGEIAEDNNTKKSNRKK